jgi:hypothetical protein
MYEFDFAMPSVQFSPKTKATLQRLQLFPVFMLAAPF